MSVHKESKLWIHPKLRRPNFSFSYSSNFIYFCIVEGVYVVIVHTAFFLFLYLTGVHFRLSYSTVVTSVSKKSAKNQCRPIRTREIGGVSLSDVLLVYMICFQMWWPYIFVNKIFIILHVVMLLSPVLQS